MQAYVPINYYPFVGKRIRFAHGFSRVHSITDTLYHTHQQKIKWHSLYSEQFEIQVHPVSIMQYTLAANILLKIVFISLRDFQTRHSNPTRVKLSLLHCFIVES